ncbi:MAG TPA: hypothetical protein DDZ88_02705 [Verrucomicrobiales bacterium]|nr:hypothetical protein [Verrucomicrobiales bacterium]
MTNILQLAEIPDDLAAEAAQVPGLPVRLVSFIRAEVSQHNRRKARKSMEARKLVEQAMAEAEEMKKSGVTVEQARKDFARVYEEIMSKIEEKP